jgi:hypothetical protein
MSEEKNKQKPTVGRIVCYTLEDGPNAGKVRPAVIVKVWSDTCVNLRVFLDGTNDSPDGWSLFNEWKTSVLEGQPGENFRWFWPPRA